MKTMVRQDSVKFGTVNQCGRNWAFVRTENSEARLYWSHLRLVESTCGGIVFSTGKSPTVHCGDAVAFVPQKEGLWLWTLRSDYDSAVEFLKCTASPTENLSVAPLPEHPASVISLDAELAALGSAQLQKWQRRYGPRRAFA